MATPVLTRRPLPGALGEILIDIRGAAPAPRPAVVILHGFKGSKDHGMLPSLADRLARAGFTAVSPTVSGSGVDAGGTFIWPDRFGHNTFSRELADVEAVIAELDAGRLGVPRPTSIGVIGYSRGGGAGILAGSRHSRIDALVTWASISTVQRWGPKDAASWRKAGVFGVLDQRTGKTLSLYTGLLDDVEANAGGVLNILAAAAAIDIPWLIVHGTADETVWFHEAEQLAAAAPEASARLLAVEGANHGFEGYLDRVFDETVAWLSRHLT